MCLMRKASLISGLAQHTNKTVGNQNTSHITTIHSAVVTLGAASTKAYVGRDWLLNESAENSVSHLHREQLTPKPPKLKGTKLGCHLQ